MTGTAGMFLNARDIAVLALRDRAGNVSAHLDRLLEQNPCSPADRAFARELALGTIRRRGTLDAVLDAFLREPGHRPPGAVPDILHVGLYQLLFLDRVPDHAAVNEAVQQAERFHHKRQSGLVNGVLRSILRAISPAMDEPPPAARDVLPVSPARYRRFDRAVFADPQAQPGAYLAGAYSLPEALATRWVRNFGGLAKAAQLAAHADARAPIIVRINTLRSDLERARKALEAEGVSAVPHVNGKSLVLAEHVHVAGLAAFAEGLIQPQDPTATAVALAAEVAPGMSVLDFCAAPGTKTTLLAERMDNRGRITALDVNEHKLQRITDNCARLGVGIVETRLSETAGGLEPQSYDVVLVDAPCSNTGVLSRRAEARWHFSAESLSSSVRDQQFLLAAGAQFVKPGGRLVYSTCSLEPEENASLAAGFAARHANFRLLDEKLTLPGGADDPARWRDGGYYAVFHAS
ncbi:MAG TPA: hypothetical protein DCX07_12090 [Phycisphaerales bacterium]|nr:hypothetical protein [Phycisphaerales bacterium]